MFVGDIVEANGKTWKENNLEIKHNIPLGKLVEINWENGEYNGVRLFVVSHGRDCDGTPLYGLSFDKNAGTDLLETEREIEALQNDHSGAEHSALMLRIAYSNKVQNLGRILDGISEESLTVISEVANVE